MDFLDPKKQRAHTIQLIVGYILIAIAVLLGTALLLELAHGFSLRQGKVIQNGLVFVSSHPSPATIYLNGERTDTTNTRLVLEAGTYTMKLTRNGYRTWQRAVTVEGGMVEHIDYPFLVPSSLTTATVRTYANAPNLATQSPDRRWLLVTQPNSFTTFDLYDVKDPKHVKRTAVSLPANLLTASTSVQRLKLVEWSNDNRHVLLEHVYGGSYEYILVDRQNPTQSVNLTSRLHLGPVELSLQNKVYDHYFVRDVQSGALTTVTLKDATPKPVLQHVLAYKTYGTNVILYATKQSAPAGMAEIMIHQSGKDYHLRTLPTATSYLLNLTKYSGSWYVAAGVSSENKVYVYQDPVSFLDHHASLAPTPVDVLKVPHPTYLAFSATTQFVMAESGTRFAVYDAQYDKDYTYTLDAPMDEPQTHATWMDGNRLAYVSAGSTVIVDYDSTNFQSLSAANPAYTPFFDQGYRTLYALASQKATAKASATTALTATSLLIPADQ